MWQTGLLRIPRAPGWGRHLTFGGDTFSTSVVCQSPCRGRGPRSVRPVRARVREAQRFAHQMRFSRVSARLAGRTALRGSRRSRHLGRVAGSKVGGGPGSRDPSVTAAWAGAPWNDGGAQRPGREPGEGKLVTPHPRPLHGAACHHSDLDPAVCEETTGYTQARGDAAFQKGHSRRTWKTGWERMLPFLQWSRGRRLSGVSAHVPPKFTCWGLTPNVMA